MCRGPFFFCFFFLTVHTKSNGPTLFKLLRRFFIFILQTWYWRGHEIFSLSRPCFYYTDFHLCNVTQYRKYLNIETMINNRHSIKWSVARHNTKIWKPITQLSGIHDTRFGDHLSYDLLLTRQIFLQYVAIYFLL